MFRYCNIATPNLSVSRVPLGPVFLVISHFTVLTATSARQFEWGNATDDRQWWTPQFRKKLVVSDAAKSGPPSLFSSSGMP